MPVAHQASRPNRRRRPIRHKQRVLRNAQRRDALRYLNLRKRNRDKPGRCFVSAEIGRAARGIGAHAIRSDKRPQLSRICRKLANGCSYLKCGRWLSPKRRSRQSWHRGFAKKFTNDRSLSSVTAIRPAQLQKLLRCKRMQRENTRYMLGSERPNASAAMLSQKANSERTSAVQVKRLISRLSTR